MTGELSGADRMAVAQLSGIAIRHGSGLADDSDGDPVSDLHAVSADPRLLGAAAARYLLEAAGGNRHAAAAVELLRAAGADEQAIAAEAELVRRRRAEPTWHTGQPPAPGS